MTKEGGLEEILQTPFGQIRGMLELCRDVESLSNGFFNPWSMLLVRWILPSDDRAV